MRKVRIEKLESGNLTTEKVYRHAYSSKEALYHIVSRVGTEFDPEMARVFVEIIER